MWHVYVASALFGTVDAFFQPAYAALLPDLTPSAALPSANALTSLSEQVTQLAGPLLGAGLVQLGGTSAAFALDGLSFIVSAACVAPLVDLSFSGATRTEKGAALRDLRDGLAFVLSSPWLWVGIGLSIVFSVSFGAPYYVALPFLVKGTALSLVYAAGTLGTIIGAAWLGHRTRIRRRGIVMYGGWVLEGLGRAALGLPIGLVGILTAALLGAVAGAASNLIWTQTVQEFVPRDKLARVFSIDILSSRVVYPVGYVGVGLVTAHIGAAVVFLGSGALIVLVCILGLAHPAIRAVD